MKDKEKGLIADDAYVYATGGDSEMVWLVIVLAMVLVVAYIVAH